jgi:DNA-binding NtrC family response regulator
MQKHILVIDDEPEIRSALSQFLGLKGYRVSAVGTGEAALRVLRTDPPHLVISDLQMEDTDGLVLIEQLKECLPSVPVMLLTGVAFDPEVVRENLSKKVSSYMSKTASLQEIVTEVRRLLGDALPPAADAARP